MSLSIPTPKQEEIIRLLASRRRQDGTIMPFDQHALCAALGLRSQAVLARLAGLRRSGWVYTDDPHPVQYMEWHISDEALDAIDFFDFFAS